jgi:Domain of unknown function (DUF4184)
MPFTISHTAVVLPFSRLLARWQILSAALIGAMVPDFRVFFPGMARVETHSAVALISFCLPVGLLSYWLFQILIKTPVLEILPDGPYARWRPFAAVGKISSMRQWLLAAGGVIVGALSHLVWDGFTHDGGRGVRMFPLLDEWVIGIGHRHLPAVYFMQDFGSLVGLVVVLAFACYGLRRGPQPAVPNRLVSGAERIIWQLVYAAAVLAASIAFYYWVRLGRPPSASIAGRASEIAIASLRGLAAALPVVSMAVQIRLRALRYRSSGPER